MPASAPMPVLQSRREPEPRARRASGRRHPFALCSERQDPSWYPGKVHLYYSSRMRDVTRPSTLSRLTPLPCNWAAPPNMLNCYTTLQCKGRSSKIGSIPDTVRKGKVDARAPRAGYMDTATRGEITV